MPLSHVLPVRRLVEPLERVLADRVEHAEAAAAPAPNKALLDERLEDVELGVAHGLRRFERKAAGEHRQPRKSCCSPARAARGSTRSSRAACAGAPGRRASARRGAAVAGRAARAAPPGRAARRAPPRARSRAAARRAGGRSRRLPASGGTRATALARSTKRIVGVVVRATARPDNAAPTRRAAARGSSRAPSRSASPPSSADDVGAASTTCSKLSRSTSSRLFRRARSGRRRRRPTPRSRARRARGRGAPATGPRRRRRGTPRPRRPRAAARAASCRCRRARSASAGVANGAPGFFELARPSDEPGRLGREVRSVERPEWREVSLTELVEALRARRGP